MKFIYSLFLTAVLTLMMSAYSYAFDIELTPEEVVPGDVFLLSIQAEGNASAEAEFLDTTINFHPAPDNGLVALVPVDINTTPQKYTVRVTYGGERRTLTVAVRSHEFKTIKLTLPEGKVTLSPENQKRAAREATRLRSIWPRNTSKLWEGRFVIPTGTEISTVFGVRRIMNEKRTSVHRGIDLRGKTGAPVRAINSGRVILTDDLFFGGNTLIIDHGMGLYSVYMHLSKFNMSKGKKVLKDQVIGFVGSSGRATGPHLHMSVKLNGVSVNPESLFKLEL